MSGAHSRAEKAARRGESAKANGSVRGKMRCCNCWRPRLLAVACAALAACGGEPVAPGLLGLPAVATLTIVRGRDTLLVADTVRLAVEARDEGGNLLAPQAVAWSTDAPAVATVSALGLVTAVGPGRATITAAARERTASLRLVVRRVVFRVNVTPDAVCLRQGYSAILGLAAYDSLGGAVPRGIRPVTWRTTNGLVARAVPLPGDSARIEGLNAGSVLVIGALMGLADTTAILVDPAPLGRPLRCGG